MAINPYGLVGGQQSVLENLLKSQQMEKDVGAGTSKQMEGMRREFQAESKSAEEAAIAELQKQFQESASSKRRRKNRGLLGNLLSFVMPGLGSALGALFAGQSSYEQMKKQKGHAVQQAIAAKAAGKMNQKRWGKSFLGKQAKDFESALGKMADEQLVQAQSLSKKDMREAAMKTGMMTGMANLAMGKAMKGLGKGFKKLSEFKGKPEGIKGWFKKGTLKDQGLGGIKGKQAMKGLEKELTALQAADPTKLKLKSDIMSAKTGDLDVGGISQYDVSELGDTSIYNAPESITQTLSPGAAETFRKLTPEQLEMILDEGVPSPFARAAGEVSGFEMGGAQRNILESIIMGLGGLGSIYEQTQDRD